MSDHTAITDSQLDAGSPVDETLMFALRDNPKATFENDPTAVAAGVVPHGMWTPDPNTTYSDGLVWDYDVDGAAATITSPEFEAGYDYRFVLSNVSGTSSAALELELRRSVDLTWEAATVIASTSAAFYAEGDITCVNPGVVSYLKYIDVRAWSRQAADNSFDAIGLSAVVTSATAQSVDMMRLDFDSGNFDNGKVYLFRSKSMLP